MITTDHNKKSAKEIAQKVKDKSKLIDSDEWIIGFGWDQTKWDINEFPISSVLDDLPISQPVMLTRIDGHSAWVNKKAMLLSGLDISSFNIDGGEIINDCILIADLFHFLIICFLKVLSRFIFFILLFLKIFFFSA